MRPPHYTITPTVVRSTARQALRKALPWQGYGRLVTVGKLLDLLLLAASLLSSLSAVVKRFRFGFSHETARKAIAANLPDLDQLHTRQTRDRRPRGVTGQHRAKLLAHVSNGWHLVEFGIALGAGIAASSVAYGYATAVLVHHRHRFTVGLIALTGGEKPHQVVAALLAQMDARGLKLRGVVLDSGFDSGETLLLLQDRKLSYTVPLRRKGNSDNRRNAVWRLEVGTVTTVEWKTDKTNRPVSTQAVVMRRPKEKEKKVYCFGGWDAEQARSEVRRASMAKRWYRKRFGIETSYRQMNEAKAMTTKKDVKYRLLLIGLGLLLRQVWVWLTGQMARDGRLRPTQWVQGLRLARMIDWLADLLEGKYKEKKEIRLESPLLFLTAA